MHHLAGGTSEFCGRTQGRDGPAAMVLCGRRLSIADQNAVAGIAVSRHFDKRKGHLLRVDIEFLLQNFSHALGRPAFLLGAAARQHSDLNVRHRASNMFPADRPARDEACPAPRGNSFPPSRAGWPTVYFASSYPAKK